MNRSIRAEYLRILTPVRFWSSLSQSSLQSASRSFQRSNGQKNREVMARNKVDAGLENHGEMDGEEKYREQRC